MSEKGWYVSTSIDYFPNGATVIRDNSEHEPGLVVAVLTNTPDKKRNAHLIAAAPELYSALVEAIYVLDVITRSETDESYNNPRFNAILAKARGETGE